jgi:hypothetical protein
MSDSDEERLKIRRQNIHESLKLIFTILMSFALTNAFMTVLQPTAIDLPHFLIARVMLFAAFLMLLLRFLLGNIRYVDKKYIEKGDLAQADFEQTPYFGMGRDYAAFFVEGSIFLLLSMFITQLLVSIFLFMFLLFFDAVWLFINIWYCKRNKLDREKAKDRNSEKNQKIIKDLNIFINDSSIWAKNNLIFSFCLSIIFIISLHSTFDWMPLIVLILISVNSAIDLFCTEATYFV